MKVNNPWDKIALSDYENHMSLDTVKQLQAMNNMMKMQLNSYQCSTAMILGVAGGNGLEHAEPTRLKKLYGVDINSEYLDVCKSRYKNLSGILECICADLTDSESYLPKTDLLISNLLIEYIGCDCFFNVVTNTSPDYVSCIIQVNTDGGFVSESPYLHVFDDLENIHHDIEEHELEQGMHRKGYALIKRLEEKLPNGKMLLQLDFRRTY